MLLVPQKPVVSREEYMPGERERVMKCGSFGGEVLLNIDETELGSARAEARNASIGPVPTA